MERKLFRKRDIILVAILLCVALFLFLGTNKNDGNTAEIWIDGELYKSFDLKEPFKISLDGGVVIEGDGKRAHFLHSDCPDKVCINTGWLEAEGEWAACLPNKTVLKITEGNGNVDTVS